jgi:hypothetical protein
VIAVPETWLVVTGIAVAPEGLGPSVVEIPTLSRTALASLAALLLLVGLSRIPRIGRPA